MLDQRVDDRLGILVANLYQHHVARLTFDEGRNLSVSATEQQIPLPVTGHGTVFNCGRPFTDRHHLVDSAVSARLQSVMPRTAHGWGAPQMLQQLLLQRTTGPNEEAAIDGDRSR